MYQYPTSAKIGQDNAGQALDVGLINIGKGNKMDLSNEKTFEHFFLFCFFMTLIYGGIAVFVLKRMGAEMGSKKVIIGISLSALPIGFLPFWLKANLSLQFKVFVPLLATIIGIAYSFGVSKVGNRFRSLFNSENKKSE